MGRALPEETRANDVCQCSNGNERWAIQSESRCVLDSGCGPTRHESRAGSHLQVITTEQFDM